MLPNGRRIGAHLPLGHGMVRAADRAAEIGASAIQVFSDNPASWRRRPTLPRELRAFRERLAAHGITPLSIHAPYLVNLASPDPELAERSVELLSHELGVAEAYGARLLNVHIGSHRGGGPELGALRVAHGLRRVLDRIGDQAPGVTVVLENGAGGGFGMGATIEELAMIGRALEGEGVPGGAVGFCLDTAHLWGAGYRIDTPAGVDELIGAFDAALGVERLRMVHLNDSRSEPGSGRDRHEHLAAGRIGVAGFRRFLEHPAIDHVAYILETPGMDAGYDEVNLCRALDIAAGRPLADLPPEAFEARSSKGRSAPAEDDDAGGDRTADAERDRAHGGTGKLPGTADAP